MACILVVDDDEHIRSLISKLLGLHGHEVDTANDGAEAIDRLGKRDYDLMIIDRNMPKMSGIDTIAIVRTSPNLRHLRILMVTAARVPKNIVEAFETGIDGYVIKPFDLSSLLGKVEKTLLQKRHGD